MSIRKLKTTESVFLEDMLYEAIFIPEGHDPLPREVIKDKFLSKYIENWGKDKVHLKKFETSIKIGLSPIPSKLAVRFVRLIKPHKSKFAFNFLAQLMSKRNAKSFNKATEENLDPRTIVLISLRSQNKELIGQIVGDSEKATSILPIMAVEKLIKSEFSGLLTPNLILSPDHVLSKINKTYPLIKWKIDKTE